jgi:S-DNA-T family DNA segregation ATPase FtsK/SpoIIIE
MFFFESKAKPKVVHKKFELSPVVLYNLIGVTILVFTPAMISWKNAKELRVASSAVAVMYSMVLLKYAQNNIDEADRLAIEKEHYFTAYANASGDAYLNSEQQIKNALLPPASSPEVDLEVLHPLEDTLLKLGIKATIDGEPIDSPTFTRFKIVPDKGVHYQKFNNLSDTLKVHMGYDTPPLISCQNKYVSIDVAKTDSERRFCEYQEYSNNLNYSLEKFTVPIGVDINNNLVEVSLSDANSPHLLIAGTTGSGKSGWLVACITSLLDRFPADKCRLFLIDPKLVEFDIFEKYKQVELVTKQEDALTLLHNLLNTMESRYELFKKHKARDLSQYNRENPKNIMPRVVVCFDEYATFMVGDSKDDFNDCLSQLAQRARSAGIHLVLATQRPDATIVTPRIRSNIPTRIALKTIQHQDSAIILGVEDGTLNSKNLCGKGDLIANYNGKLERLQGLYVKDVDYTLSNTEIKELTNVDSPCQNDEIAYSYGEAQDSEKGEVYTHFSKTAKKDSVQAFESKNKFVTSLVKLKIAALMSGDMDETEPLFDDSYGLSSEQQLLVLKFFLDKNIGKERTIKALWGTSSGGKNHHKYQKSSAIYDDMISKIKELEYSTQV